MPVRFQLSIALLAAALGLAPAAAAPGGLSPQDVNNADLAKPAGKSSRALNAKAQVLLDRAGFSPGAIQTEMDKPIKS